MICMFVLLFINILSIDISADSCCNQILTDGKGYALLKDARIPSSNGVTVSVWVTSFTEGTQDVLEYVDPDNTSILYFSTDQAWFLGHVIGNLKPTSSKLNTSSHLIFTWGSETGVNLHQDGALIGEESSETFTGKDLNLNGTWQMGVQLGNSYDSAGGLVGSLCGMTVWSYEMSPDDVNKTFFQGKGVSEKSPSQTGAPSVTWEDFDQNGTTLDSSNCSSPIKLTGSGIRLGNLDAVSSKFVILFLVIIGVVIGFAGLFLCSEREIAIKRANINKRLQKEDHFSIDNGSTHSIT